MDATLQLTRTKIEEAIEHLLFLLDEIDGNPDDEETGDLEPSLGKSSFYHAGVVYEDCETDRSDWEPNGDELDYCRGEHLGQWKLNDETWIVRKI